MNKKRFGAFAIALFSSSALHAQSITSDRPGIGSGSAIVCHKTIQLEAGFDYARADTNDTYSVGQALVRLGAPGFEVELFVNSFVVTRTHLAGDSLEGEGFQDLGIGVKVPLLAGAGRRFTLSAQGILLTPTGSDGFSNDEWVPAAILLADISVADRIGLAINAGYQAGPGDVDDVFSLILTPSLSLGRRFGVYAGWAGFFSDEDDSHFAEGGVTYLANDNVQLDLNGGWDVETDGYFLGFGIAVRWR